MSSNIIAKWIKNQMVRVGGHRARMTMCRLVEHDSGEWLGYQITVWQGGVQHRDIQVARLADANKVWDQLKLEYM